MTIAPLHGTHRDDPSVTYDTLHGKIVVSLAFLQCGSEGYRLSQSTELNSNETPQAALVFDRINQFNSTAPFEVLSQLPNALLHSCATAVGLVCDAHSPHFLFGAGLDVSPRLNLRLMPGGPGQEALMEDDCVLH